MFVFYSSEFTNPEDTFKYYQKFDFLPIFEGMTSLGLSPSAFYSFDGLGLDPNVGVFTENTFSTVVEPLGLSAGGGIANTLIFDSTGFTYSSMGISSSISDWSLYQLDNYYVNKIYTGYSDELFVYNDNKELIGTASLSPHNSFSSNGSLFVVNNHDMNNDGSNINETFYINSTTNGQLTSLGGYYWGNTYETYYNKPINDGTFLLVGTMSNDYVVICRGESPIHLDLSFIDGLSWNIEIQPDYLIVQWKDNDGCYFRVYDVDGTVKNLLILVFGFLLIAVVEILLYFILLAGEQLREFF